MFWIGMLAGYFLGFVLAWILLNAIRGWDLQGRYCARGGQPAMRSDTGRA